jgi:hypothetical protein
LQPSLRLFYGYMYDCQVMVVIISHHFFLLNSLLYFLFAYLGLL